MFWKGLSPLVLENGSCTFIDEDGIPPADEDEAFLDEFDLPEGKIGAKKLRKLQEKAEKRRQREVKFFYFAVI